jgi:hypothetical protein
MPVGKLLPISSVTHDYQTNRHVATVAIKRYRDTIKYFFLRLVAAEQRFEVRVD